MRALAIGFLLLAASPLAAAHDDNLVYRLVLPTGASAGPVAFQLSVEHTFLGMGLGGCAATALGALRILTPGGGALEATYAGIQGCAAASTSVVGEPARLPAGVYTGVYAFASTAPILIEIYGSHAHS